MPYEYTNKHWIHYFCIHIKTQLIYFHPMLLRVFLTGLCILALLKGAALQDIEQSIADLKPRFSHVIKTGYQYGSVLQTNEYLRGEYESGQAVKHFQAISLSVGWQARGDKVWHHLYGNPSWGLGIYHAGFSRPDDLGAPYTFYGYYGGPFKRWNRFSIDYIIKMGFSTNWKPFDETDNPYQISLGDDKAAFASLGLLFTYRLSPHFDLETGLIFSHFSNGSTVKPNKGINLAAPQLGLHYHLKGVRPVTEHVAIPPFKQNWEWLINLSFARKQVAFDTTHAPREIDRRYIGVNYSVLGLSSALYRQLTYKSKLGAGIDLFYDESFTARIDTENNTVTETSTAIMDRLAAGIYGSYELTANRLSFFLDGGLYLLREERGNQTPAFYQRIGMKYHVLPNFYAGICIKAYNFKVADFMGWNIGYRIRWRS